MYLLLGLEERALGRLVLLLALLLEVVVVQVGRQIDFGNIQLSGRGDHVTLVHASQRAAVESVRSSDQQQATSQLLQEYHTLQKQNMNTCEI